MQMATLAVRGGVPGRGRPTFQLPRHPETSRRAPSLQAGRARVFSAWQSNAWRDQVVRTTNRQLVLHENKLSFLIWFQAPYPNLTLL